MRLEVRDLQSAVVSTEHLSQVASRTAARVGLVADHVGLVLVDDERIQEMNLRFRGYDRSTDVLTFAEDGEGLDGEIIISVESAERQARDAGHPAESELAWLVAHSVLHLAGMDDETEDGLNAMLLEQRAIMVELGIKVCA